MSRVLAASCTRFRCRVRRWKTLPAGCCDNLNDAYDVRMKQRRLARLEGRHGFTFEHVDIWTGPRDRGLGRTRGPFAAVINLAARAGVRQSVDNPWVYVDTNTTGTLNLLDLCRRDGVGKFVLASTSSLYGSTTPCPIAKTQTPTGRSRPTPLLRRAAEALCYTYHYLYGLDVTIFRYFTVYRPGRAPRHEPLSLRAVDQRGAPGAGLRRRLADPAISPTWTTSPGAPSWG